MDNNSNQILTENINKLIYGHSTVLVGEAATKLERIAAEDLSMFLGNMMGEKLSVIDYPDALEQLPDGMSIIVGTPQTSRIVRETVKKGMIMVPEPCDDQTAVIRAVMEKEKIIIFLIGQSPSGSMNAVYDFLENQCNVGFFPDGNQVPDRLELDPAVINRDATPRCRHRIYSVHPFWTEPYEESSRLWNFEKWRTLLDWMRRKRMNGLLVFHDEGSYTWGDIVFRAFPEITPDEESLKRFAMVPEYRTELNKKIFTYARENGINIVYNLSYGQIPCFARKAFPDLVYHEESMDSLTICASQPECRDMTLRYWKKLLETYGADDGHLYVVCPYMHERLLCDKFSSRAEAAGQAYEVLKSIDPKANIFFENWDWPWGDFQGVERASNEWRGLLATTPGDAGVIDFDRRFNLKKGGQEAFNWYQPRPWIQLEMSTLEGAYPPSGTMLPPDDMVYIMDGALRHGAAGLALFNIMTRGNELLSTIAADIPWIMEPHTDKMIRRFVALRFGSHAEKNMQLSFDAYRKSIDGALLMPGFDSMCYRPLDESKVARGFEGLCNSGEFQLNEWLDGEDHDFSWIESKLSIFLAKMEFAREAAGFAWLESDRLRNSNIYRNYVWELEYISARWEGVVALFRAYRENEHPSRKEEYFQGSLKAFQKVKELYRGLPEYSMEKLELMAPEVRYTPYFLENWHNYDEKAETWKDIIWRFHVVWERFREYEDYLGKLQPSLKNGTGG